MSRQRPIPLRWRDLDAFGHVYHGEFLTLLDEARTGWVADTLAGAHPESYVLARLEIDYVSPLKLEDGAVEVEFSVARVGTSSLTLTETMRTTGGRVVSTGRSVIVMRDPASGSSRPLTDDERSRV